MVAYETVMLACETAMLACETAMLACGFAITCCGFSLWFFQFRIAQTRTGVFGKVHSLFNAVDGVSPGFCAAAVTLR